MSFLSSLKKAIIGDLTPTPDPVQYIEIDSQRERHIDYELTHHQMAGTAESYLDDNESTDETFVNGIDSAIKSDDAAVVDFDEIHRPYHIEDLLKNR